MIYQVLLGLFTGLVFGYLLGVLVFPVLTRKSGSLRSARIPTSQLLKRARPDKPVVLVSGGPIMDLTHDDGIYGNCEWRYEGKHHRAVFPLVCLYECHDLGDYVREGGDL